MESRRFGLAGLSGVLLILSFPRFGHWAVAWVALAPLLLVLPGATARQAIGLGWLTGFVSSVGLLYWTSLVAAQYGGLPLWLGVGAMLLLALTIGLFPALFAFLTVRWLRAFGSNGLLLAPFAWVATEVIRAYTFYRFSWCLLGYSQQPNLPVIQIASVTAVYGVSFLVAATSAVIAYVIYEKRPRRRCGVAVGFATLIAAVIVWGGEALSRSDAETGRIRVGLVQASIPQDEKWTPRKAQENIEHHLRLSRAAASQGARLIIWPESSLPYFFDEHESLAADLRDFARAWQIHLLFGNDDREPEPRGRVFVGAKMLAPTGELTLRYHKMRLVPFGEFVPLQWLIRIGGSLAARMVGQVGDFAPGDEAVVGSVDGHQLGAFICYEAIFPDLIRQFTARGASLLVNITNDAWYGRTSAPYQHVSMAALRAVENGTYLVRAANTGVSAVIDPRGRMIARTELFERTVLVRDVPFVPARTFYARHGDVFCGICTVIAILLTGWTIFRRSGGPAQRSGRSAGETGVVVN